MILVVETTKEILTKSIIETRYGHCKGCIVSLLNEKLQKSEWNSFEELLSERNIWNTKEQWPRSAKDNYRSDACVESITVDVHARTRGPYRANIYRSGSNTRNAGDCRVNAASLIVLEPFVSEGDFIQPSVTLFSVKHIIPTIHDQQLHRNGTADAC